jgi:hypothetical protein
MDDAQGAESLLPPRCFYQPWPWPPRGLRVRGSAPFQRASGPEVPNRETRCSGGSSKLYPIVALGSCSELHPGLEVLRPSRPSASPIASALDGISRVGRSTVGTVFNVATYATARPSSALDPAWPSRHSAPRSASRTPRIYSASSDRNVASLARQIGVPHVTHVVKPTPSSAST